MNRRQRTVYEQLRNIATLAAAEDVELVALGRPLSTSEYGPLLDDDENPWLNVWIRSDLHEPSPDRYAAGVVIRDIAGRLGFACSFRLLAPGVWPGSRPLIGQMFSPDCPPYFASESNLSAIRIAHVQTQETPCRAS